MSQDKIAIGIVGTGVGLRTYLPAFRNLGDAQVIGIVGSSLARAEEFAAKHSIPRAFGDYKQLIDLPDVDLVCIATPNPDHYEQILYALHKNKNVLAEKPLAMTLQQTTDLSKEAKTKDVLTLIDHQLRFNPYLIKVREIIRNNELGRPYFIRIHQQSTGFSNRNATWNWSFDESMGGGVRLAMATHLIDLLWFWLGNPKIYSVKGSMDVVVPERKDLEGNNRQVNAASFFSADLSLDKNLTVHLSATAAAISTPRFDFSIYGTDGELHFDLISKLSGSFLSRPVVEKIPVDGVTPEEAANKASIFSGSFVYFAPRLVEAVATKNRQSVAHAATFEDAIPTQQVLDAIKESAVRGEQIQLETGYSSNASV